MSKFSEKAKSLQSGSELLKGREKIAIESIIESFPDGIHIDGFDLLSKDGDVFAAFTFTEYPKGYFFSGTIGTQVATEWAKMFSGNIDAANLELSAEPVHCVLSRGKTKNGRTITRYEFD